MAVPEAQGKAPRRVLTDWTTVAGVDGTGQLALVTGSATAEGIHLATLGYEVFVLHADQVSAATAEQAAHVHHVVADLDDLPSQWSAQFGLVVALDGSIAANVVAANGLAVVVRDQPVQITDFTTVAVDAVAEGFRSVLARLTAERR